MNRPAELFVLTQLTISPEGHVLSKNVGVTFDVFAADAHRALAVENDFERYPLQLDWLERAEQSSFVSAMRAFRGIVDDLQRDALR